MTPPCNHCYKSSSEWRRSTPSFLLQHCRIHLIKSDWTEGEETHTCIKQLWLLHLMPIHWTLPDLLPAEGTFKLLTIKRLSCPGFGLSGVAQILRLSQLNCWIDFEP